MCINSLPNLKKKYLDLSKLKALADEKLNGAETVKFVFERVKNIVGKGGNAYYQQFSFPHIVYKSL